MPRDKPRNDPPSANEQVAKLRLKLRHISLPELEWAGLVRWDRANQIVKEDPLFDD